MKRQLPQLNFGVHRPLRFGRRLRGHELPLRIVQVLVLVWLGVVGGQLIAKGVTHGGGTLIGIFHPAVSSSNDQSAVQPNVNANASTPGSANTTSN